MEAQRVLRTGCSFGADPELFVSDADGKILPSFAFLPEKPPSYDQGVVRDGVQVELRPLAHTCREVMQSRIRDLLNHLNLRLPKGAKINFASNITIPKGTFQKLDPDARRLGCMPSLNVYGPALMRVNQDTYRRRSAGGHIHLGGLCRTMKEILPTGEKVPTDLAVRLVKTLDAVLGNTCVLIDRDPDAAIRRRVYGRAGEYRLPGANRLEYRVLSNFWLRAPYLQSMVFALARQAVDIVQQNSSKVYYKWDAYTKLWETGLSEKKVARAINKNDYDLAFENWLLVRDFLSKHFRQESGLKASNMSQFDAYLVHVKEHGLESVTPMDPAHHWIRWQDQRFHGGFEHWLRNFTPGKFKPAGTTVGVAV